MSKLRMSLVALCAALPLAAAAQSPQWVVRDLDGELVGPVLLAGNGAAVPERLGEDSPLWVARRIPGKWLQLSLTEKAVWATRNPAPFLYETYDCSGPAFLEAPRKKNQVVTTVLFDTEVYWPAGPAANRVITAKGVLVSSPDECQDALLESGLCCSTLPEAEEHFAAQIASQPLAQLELRPPFRLEPVASSSK